MAHKTKIDGADYEVSVGRVMMDYTNYNIAIGKTRVDGVVYDVSCGCLVEIQTSYSMFGNFYGSIEIDGNPVGIPPKPEGFEPNRETISVPYGATMTCKAKASAFASEEVPYTAYISVNEKRVAESNVSGTVLEYTHTIQSNLLIKIVMQGGILDFADGIEIYEK